MEKMNIVFFIIIVVYLIYSYLKAKKENEKKEIPVMVKEPEKKDTYEDEYEKYVVAAAIAAVMGDTAYRIKNVFLTATPDEKKSAWKLAGREEIMAKRVFFSKK